jgi:hypothetical protein
VTKKVVKTEITETKKWKEKTLIFFFINN